MFPATQQQRVREYTTLILTFLAMIFFAIFAINPTITTVLELRKKLEDAEFVRDSLEQKVANLSTLQDRYDSLGDDLTVILNAIPENPRVPLLFGQIQGVSQGSGARITALQSQEVQQAVKGKPIPKDASFTFVLEAQGSYPQVSSFLNSLSNFERSITIESVSITPNKENGTQLVLSVRGKAHFRQ